MKGHLYRACVIAQLVPTIVLAGACRRETRPFKDLPAASARAQSEAETPLFAGGPVPATATTSPLQANAWAQSEGKRLFTTFNCAGCHANGGGGIGPALMDDQWIYGYLPGNIFSSIVEGRPNGMPSFRNKIPDYQVWQLVAYVQSMSGQNPIDTLSGRSDHMQVHAPEVAQPYQGRKQTGHR